MSQEEWARTLLAAPEACRPPDPELMAKVIHRVRVRRRRWVVGGAAVAVVALAVGTAGGVVASRDHASPTIVAARPGPVTASEIAAMKKAGSDFVPVADPSVAKVSAARAIATALGQSGFLAGGRAAQVSLGYLTVHHLRKVAESPGGGIRQISLLIDHRLVWLVAVPGVPQEGLYSGPMPQPGYAPPLVAPSNVTATIWEAVDALTGKVLYAETL